MFVRKKKNKSGSISIQIIDKSSGKYKVVKTIGSSNDLKEIDKLYMEAYETISLLHKQNTFKFLSSNDENILSFTQSLSNSNITAVGAKLVFGRLFDTIGFNIIKDKLFRDLVLSRIIYQGSKLKLVDYLRRYEHKDISIGRIYRFSDKLHSKYKNIAEETAFNHTKKILKNITVVFYNLAKDKQGQELA